MNPCLYFIFPNIEEEAETVACCEDVLKYLQFFNYERFDAFWDERPFRDFCKKMKSERASNADFTSLSLRRMKYTALTDIRHLGVIPEKVSLSQGNIPVTDDPIGMIAYHKYSSEEKGVVIGICGAQPPHHIELYADNEWSGGIMIAPVIYNIKECHIWFSENREPSRFFNHDYPKHRAEERQTQKGVASSMPLTKEEVETALKLAVGDKNEGRLLHYCASHDIVIVFSKEGREIEGKPVYHGHRVLSDDACEISRLPSTIKKRLNALHSTNIK